MKILKGDKVQVIAGKDKGKQGEVLQTAPRVGKILVEGVNIIKKHIKAEQSKKGVKVGQRIELPAFINISNAKLICPNCKKPARVGYLIDEKGEKKRVCKKCKQIIEHKSK